MTSPATVPVLTIRQPGDLIEAVPYLLGFHPAESLVVVGLADGRVSVTARLDLAPDVTTSELQDVVAVLRRSASRQAVAVVYAPPSTENQQLVRSATSSLPYLASVEQLADQLHEQGIDVLDALLVAGERYFSYLCPLAECCPPQGRVLPGDASTSAATATYAGLVALPDRQAVMDAMAPYSPTASPRMGKRDGPTF